MHVRMTVLDFFPILSSSSNIVRPKYIHTYYVPLQGEGGRERETPARCSCPMRESAHFAVTAAAAAAAVAAL